VVPTYFFCDFLRFSGLVLENICMVFLSSSCRETAKRRDKTNRSRKKVFFLNFFGKTFLHGLPPKSACGVFELALLRNAKKKAYKKLKKRKAPTYPI
jgi:hypothetical protein